MGKRLLSYLGFAPSVMRKLEEASLFYDEDLRNMTASELVEVSGLSLQESCEVLSLCESDRKPVTLLDMIEASPSSTNITTLSSELDTMLGGGLSVASVTEIAGTPGIGKTQICLQLSICVQLPEALGGLEGEAVIVDTEGSVHPMRIKEMAEFAVSYYRKHFSSPERSEDFSVDKILSKIHYYRCLNQLTVVACIKQLHRLLQTHPQIKLVVVDSLAFHLRHDIPDFRIRAGLLASLTQDLIKLATKHHLAVLLTNQMTTRITSEGQDELVPALGESWAHCPTVRVVCRWVDGVRTAQLIKAPDRPNTTVSFQVTAAGIRDIDEEMGTKEEEAASASMKRKRVEEETVG